MTSLSWLICPRMKMCSIDLLVVYRPSVQFSVEFLRCSCSCWSLVEIMTMNIDWDGMSVIRIYSLSYSALHCNKTVSTLTGDDADLIRIRLCITLFIACLSHVKLEAFAPDTEQTYIESITLVNFFRLLTVPIMLVLVSFLLLTISLETHKETRQRTQPLATWMGSDYNNINEWGFNHVLTQYCNDCGVSELWINIGHTRTIHELS